MSNARNKMPEVRNKMVPLSGVHLKMLGDEEGGGYSFSGYASVFNVVDSYGDVMKPGCFAEALKTGYPIGMFFNHDSWEVPIGKWDVMKEDDHGLYVEGTLTKGLPLAESVRLALLHKTVTGMSVGFGVDFEHLEYDENVDGFIFEQVKYLREISICTFPANADAQVDEVKSLQQRMSALSGMNRTPKESINKEKQLAELSAMIDKSLI